MNPTLNVFCVSVLKTVVVVSALVRPLANLTCQPIRCCNIAWVTVFKFQIDHVWTTKSMRSCVHMCDKARVITLIMTGFMIIVIVKFYQHYTLKMWRLYAIFFLSVFLCVLPALMCWTWSFYNIFNITPQGLTTQTTSLTMQERAGEMKGCEARWHWTISAVNPFVFHFPYLQCPLEPIKQHTQTHPRTLTKKHYIFQISHYASPRSWTA